MQHMGHQVRATTVQDYKLCPVTFYFISLRMEHASWEIVNGTSYEFGWFKSLRKLWTGPKCDLSDMHLL